MAGGKTNYLQAVILKMIFQGVAWTPPATLYVALSTAAFSFSATGSAMTEVVGGSYARVAVATNTTNFANPSGGAPTSTSNLVAITFPTATAAWGTVTSVYLLDAASAGNALYGGDLSASKAINSGDTATFAANALTPEEN